jgi:hypothetical protein
LNGLFEVFWDVYMEIYMGVSRQERGWVVKCRSVMGIEEIRWL